MEAVFGEEAGRAEAEAAAATPDTRAMEEEGAEEGVGVWIDPELSSRDMASLFSLDLRF